MFCLLLRAGLSWPERKRSGELAYSNKRAMLCYPALCVQAVRDAELAQRQAEIQSAVAEAASSSQQMQSMSSRVSALEKQLIEAKETVCGELFDVVALCCAV